MIDHEAFMIEKRKDIRKLSVRDYVRERLRTKHSYT